MRSGPRARLQTTGGDEDVLRPRYASPTSRIKTRIHRQFGSIRHWKSALFVLFLLVVVGTTLLTMLVNSFIFADDRDADTAWWQLWRRTRDFMIPGEVAPVEPQLLPGLEVQRPPRLSPEELLLKYGDMDFLYTAVDFSDMNYLFRRTAMQLCGDWISELEMMRVMRMPTGEVHADCLLLPKHHLTKAELRAVVADTKVNNQVHKATSDPRNDSSDLRYSMRSVEKHIPWHRGRLRLVSTGHVPSWVDGARNFMSGACGGGGRRAGEHVRLTTVHQDALLPYGARLTTNSHVIEKFLWRVRGLTPVHVYLNDDYFVNRPAKVTDFVNEYGGTIIRTEVEPVKMAERASTSTSSWADGVLNTNLFNVYQLDVLEENYLPERIPSAWSKVFANITESLEQAIVSRMIRKKGEPPLPLYAREVAEFPVLSLDSFYGIALVGQPPKLPERILLPEGRTPLDRLLRLFGIGEREPLQLRHHRRRYYAAHAPFTYCTNMLRFLETRYVEEFAHQTVRNRARSSKDFYVPFMYNAFTLSRPWQASPHFLSYLYMLRLANTGNMQRPTLTIDLNNEDGCAPATQLVGSQQSHAHFMQFVDDMRFNKQFMAELEEINPLFFNVNSAFTTPQVKEQITTLLQRKFPDPIFLDVARPDEDAAAAELRATHAALMRLPVVLVVAHRENACGLLRSLQLGLREHAGPVQVVVVGNAALGSAPWCSALPTVQCDYNSTVVTQRAVGSEAELQGVLAEVGRGATAVRVPAACEARGGGGGAGAEVRLLVIDARATEGAGADKDGLHALAALGQTLALEDFATVRVGGADGSAAALRVDRDSDIHWVYGGCESDLLQTYPLPLERYEIMEGKVRWLTME